MSRFRTLSLALIVGCAWATHARAQLVAYDPFNYPTGGVVGQSGGGSFGFSSPWAPGGFNASQSSNFLVAPGSLQRGLLATDGGRLTSGSTSVISGITRNLSTPIGAGGTTRYVSFLVEPQAPLHQGVFNGFFGLLFETAGEPELFIGKPGGGAIGNYVLEDRGGSGQFVSNFLTTPGETALLVVKAEFMPTGNDRFTLYVNPVPGMPEPASASVFKNDSNIGSVTGLTIYSTGAFELDEIRLGTTFAAVTPVVPEPGVLLVLPLAAWVVSTRRRSRP